MRRLILALAAAALVTAAPVPAFAHGGQYRHPPGEVPPDSRNPEDPPPPDTGGGTPTPPDGTGTPTPPDGTGTPTPPDGGSPAPDRPTPPSTPAPTPGSGGPKAPGTPTGRGPASKGASWDAWTLWWNHNKDALVDVRRRRPGAVSAGNSIGVTTTNRPQEGEGVDLTARAFEARVVPLLRAIAGDPGEHFDVRSAAVLALAKAGRRDVRPLLQALAAGTPEDGRRPHRVVEESAALALGLLGDADSSARAFLRELAADTTAATRTRAFAAISLGLLGGPDCEPGSRVEDRHLLESLAAAREASSDVPSAALTALGLLGDRDAVPVLTGWLREERAGARDLNDHALSFVALALGKLGVAGRPTGEVDAALEALVAQLRGRNRLTRASTAIALGRISNGADESVRRRAATALEAVIAGRAARRDTTTANFAIASLGRLAAEREDALGDHAVELLVRTYLDARNPDRRGFAALALGIAGRGSDAARRAEIARPLYETLPRLSNEHRARGATMLALGLLEDRRSLGLLADTLRTASDPELRGTAAVAVGLIGDERMAPDIRGLLERRTNQSLALQAATGAALLRDRGAVDLLVKTLEDPRSSQYLQGSAAVALGTLGDERAVAPLAAVVRDAEKRQAELTRALAVVALGRLGDRHPVPLLHRVSEDVNYRAHVDAIAELLTIL